MGGGGEELLGVFLSGALTRGWGSEPWPSAPSGRLHVPRTICLSAQLNRKAVLCAGRTFSHLGLPFFLLGERVSTSSLPQDI